MINFLNKNPLVLYTHFKEYAIEIFLKGNYEFNLRKNILNNIFYPWLKQSKIFNLYSIFDNNKTIKGDQYLKDVSFS